MVFRSGAKDVLWIGARMSEVKTGLWLGVEDSDGR